MSAWVLNATVSIHHVGTEVYPEWKQAFAIMKETYEPCMASVMIVIYHLGDSIIVITFTTIIKFIKLYIVMIFVPTVKKRSTLCCQYISAFKSVILRRSINVYKIKEETVARRSNCREFIKAFQFAGLRDVSARLLYYCSPFKPFKNLFKNADCCQLLPSRRLCNYNLGTEHN